MIARIWAWRTLDPAEDCTHSLARSEGRRILALAHWPKVHLDSTGQKPLAAITAEPDAAPRNGRPGASSRPRAAVREAGAYGGNRAMNKPEFLGDAKIKSPFSARYE